MNRLENKVNAYNVIVKEINKQVPKVLEILKEFENKKVVTVNHTLTYKAKTKLAEVLDKGKMLCVPYVSSMGGGSLYLNFRITYKTDEYSCDYIDKSVNISCTTNGILTDITEFTPYPTTTLNKVKKAQDKAQKVKEEYNKKIEAIRDSVPYQFRKLLPNTVY